MSETIDQVLFADVLKLDPREVGQRTGCAWDKESQSFVLETWGGRTRVCPGNETVTALEPGHMPSGEYLSLLLVHYLIHSQPDRPTESWVSEKDIPGGAAFFRGPHAFPVERITRRFDNDLAAFESACRELGGRPLELADKAFAFEVLPRVPVAVLYWLGDEDFPCEAKLLFDRSIDRHLPLDIIYALAVLVCRVVGGVSTP